jgi:hypothetical protein
MISTSQKKWNQKSKKIFSHTYSITANSSGIAEGADLKIETVQQTQTRAKAIFKVLNLPKNFKMAFAT